MGKWLQQAKEAREPEPKSEQNIRAAVQRARKGQFRRRIVLPVSDKYRDFWGTDIVAIAKTREEMNSLRQDYPGAVVLYWEELGHVLDVVERQGLEAAKHLLQARAIFGPNAEIMADDTGLWPDEADDPGAEISPGDTHLWLILLREAKSLDIELWSKLAYLRGAGCRLEQGTKGYVIRPIIDAEGKRGWTSVEEYDREKQCLEPYRQDVVRLLKEVGPDG